MPDCVGPKSALPNLLRSQAGWFLPVPASISSFAGEVISFQKATGLTSAASFGGENRWTAGPPLG